MVLIRTVTCALAYAVSLCGILPLFPWLGWQPRIFLLLGFSSGLCQYWRRDWFLPSWMQNVVIVPVFLFYASQFSRANAVQPVVSILAIMLAVRLAGMKNVRHILQILALSLFCLASSSLFDLSPVFLMYLALMLLLTAVTLVLLSFQSHDDLLQLTISDLKKVLAAGVVMPMLSIPALLLFFPILPRTQMPLWNFFSAPTISTSGFSDKVEPGVQVSVSESRALAFRAEMPVQSQSRIYWRGSVFNRLVGNRWVREVNLPFEQPQFSDNYVEHLIYPEPAAFRVLIALDRTSEIYLHRQKRAPDGVFEYTGHLGKRINYRARSDSNSSITVKAHVNRPFYLHLPPDFSPRIRLLAREISSSGYSDYEKLELLSNYFRNGRFSYSMSGLPTGENALESFLFGERRGHCEFFASAFAVMLRSSGIPCRLVGGYAGGEYNRLGGYYQVSDDMAHVWVEVCLEGKRWLRVDPSEFAVNAGETFNKHKSGSLMMKTKMMLDYLNYEWNRSVVVYDFEQQFEFVRKTGRLVNSFDFARLLRQGGMVLVLTAILFFICFIVYRHPRFCTREERVLRSFLRNVGKHFGVDTKNGGAGLFEIAERTKSVRVREFVSIYAGAVYCDRCLNDQEYRRLKQILRDGF